MLPLRLAPKVGLVTLGCDKNTVDSERYLAQLMARGVVPTDDLGEADIIVVNTCGFIDAAKRESLDAIVDAGRHKEGGRCRALVAVGCLVQRHKSELADSLPEVDFFLGASEVERLVPELEARGLLGDAPEMHPGERIYAGTAPHVRYLKVSEGCDHGCAFCAIPLMRGRHRSFAMEDVIREAQLLEVQGAREVNLVAQDLAHYGRDLPGRCNLPELLDTLVRETGIPWLRLHYLYSAGITPALLEVVAREPRIVRYLDMPIQHASDSVLARMRRPERQRTIREKVARYRDAIPGVAIRTTCIVGFPGETDADFDELLDFLEETGFDRVGAFTYSAQDGTRAASLIDDVPDVTKRDRLERLTELQRAITGERYERRVGTTACLLVNEPAGVDGLASARAGWQADDIDGVTWLDADVPAGAFVEVEVTDVVDDYDFDAHVLSVVESHAPAPVVRRSRALPMASIGSFGR